MQYQKFIEEIYENDGQNQFCIVVLEYTNIVVCIKRVYTCTFHLCIICYKLCFIFLFDMSTHDSILPLVTS